MERESNFTFLRELQAELGMESRCECGLLSLAYALAALKGRIFPVLAKHIRKKWKYVKAEENGSLPLKLLYGQETFM